MHSQSHSARACSCIDRSDPLLKKCIKRNLQQAFSSPPPPAVRVRHICLVQFSVYVFESQCVCAFARSGIVIIVFQCAGAGRWKFSHCWSRSKILPSKVGHSDNADVVKRTLEIAYYTNSRHRVPRLLNRPLYTLAKI